MKNIFKYILAISIIGEIFASCSLKEDAILPDSESNKGSRLVVAHVADFSQHDVSTKGAENDERQISELAMLVFGDVAKKENEVLGEETGTLITSPLFVKGEKLNFVINTTVGTNDEEGQYIANVQDGTKHSFAQYKGDLENCRVYIVANMNTVLEKNLASLSTEKSFLDITYKLLENVPEGGAEYSVVTTVPEGGFPMIGSVDTDLRYNSEVGDGSQQALTITLKKLFAKINFKFLIQVPIEDNPDHMSMVKIPYFEPTSWSVHNIPADFTLREEEAKLNPADLVFKTQDFTTFSFSTELSKLNKRIENSDTGAEYFEFSFYMPEYKVYAPNSLPAGIDEKFLQGYKPTLCTVEQNPTYVHVKGKYSNHQGQICEVEYDLYLGQNELDDFQIMRNQQLNNIAKITGLTNHKDGENVSLDWRVNINSSGYSIAMERETLLDSHFEFRRMDVSVEEGSVVVVKIPTEYTWFAAEGADIIHQDGTNLDLYDKTKPGLRKYFTPSLINDLRGNREFVLRGPEENNNDITEVNEHRLWFYFDENVENPYNRLQGNSENNQLYREGKVLVDFYDNTSSFEDGGTPTQKDREFTFRQMNLWIINGKEHTYNIEYFEEYLYNYASDDNFGVTTDGMEWGLKESQLSTQYRAIYANSVSGILSAIGWTDTDFYDKAFEGIDTYYDFYLQRDNVSKSSRDYNGIHFTKEIVEKTGIFEKTLYLSGDDNNSTDDKECEGAESAVEYCYNKNKRNSAGEVETIHWYLPAIDETEEILVDGFNFFPVFQSKWYWSSQPSYRRFSYNAKLYLEGLSSASGYYYKDDINRARATRVSSTDTNVDSERSGVKDNTANANYNSGNLNIDIALRYVIFGEAYVSGKNEDVYSTIPEGAYEDGNQLRETPNRVRCVYDSKGIDIKPYALSKVLGTYSVVAGSSATSTNNRQTFDVTISESDNASEGNVKLSCYLHRNYHDTNYPQYGTYDSDTGVLSIPMGQNVAANQKSVLYNGNNRESSQILTLQYNKEDKSFSVIGNGMNLRTSNSTNSASYIQSFKKK